MTPVTPDAQSWSVCGAVPIRGSQAFSRGENRSSQTSKLGKCFDAMRGEPSHTGRGTKRTFKKAGLNHINRAFLTSFGLAGYYPDWANWASATPVVGWPSVPSVEAPVTSTVSESVSEATSTSHGADRPGALARPLLERYSLERVDAGLAIGSELCRRLPGPGGVRAVPAPKGSPAPTKQAVARVATSGYSNPETALRLADSVKRVESHLTHPYAKLGISSRRELAVPIACR